MQITNFQLSLKRLHSARIFLTCSLFTIICMLISASQFQNPFTINENFVGVGIYSKVREFHKEPNLKNDSTSTRLIFICKFFSIAFDTIGQGAQVYVHCGSIHQMNFLNEFRFVTSNQKWWFDYTEDRILSARSVFIAKPRNALFCQVKRVI